MPFERSTNSATSKPLVNCQMARAGVRLFSMLRLAQHGFPGLAGHRAEHQRLLARLQEAVNRLQHGEAVKMSDLLCFLHDWFFDHVEGMDQQYGSWLNEHGMY